MKSSKEFYDTHHPGGEGYHVYKWDSDPVGVEFKSGWLDVSAYSSPSEHPDGIIPEGETHALVWYIKHPDRGWWMDAEAFREYAEPLNPSAVRLESNEELE